MIFIRGSNKPYTKILNNTINQKGVAINNTSSTHLIAIIIPDNQGNNNIKKIMK